MADLDVADRLIRHGSFSAVVCAGPSLRVRYSIRGPEAALCEIQKKAGGMGKRWQDDLSWQWKVYRVGEMRALADRLLSETSHPRYPVVLAWSKCVYALPSIERTKAWEAGKVYRSKDSQMTRPAAAANLIAARNEYPVESWVRPLTNED